MMHQITTKKYSYTTIFDPTEESGSIVTVPALTS